ncbi:MAG: DNA starvation/stationary phase protection protein [Flavobacteriaceae bacterium]
MKTLQTTGLNAEGAKEVTKLLNELLSNFQILYMNLRGFHWNIKGRRFFMLHEKFEELYKDTSEKSDAIAERVLTLDAIPYHSFNDYLKHSEINVVENVSDGDTAVDHLIKSYSLLLGKERIILKNASKNNDEATVAMMSDFIGEQETLLWMLKAYLSN